MGDRSNRSTQRAGGGTGLVYNEGRPPEGVTAMPSATDRITGRNLIAGRWLPANGAAFASRSPADRDAVLGEFPSSAPALAGEAVAAARAAYPGWRRTS